VARHLSNFATLCSLIAASLILVAWPLARHTDPRTQRVQLGSQRYVSLDAYGPDGRDARLVIFNLSFGPYCGGIVGVGTRVSGFGDTLGIYYRRLTSADIPGSWWTLRISLAYPLVVAVVLPLVWLLQRRWLTRAQRGSPVEPTERGLTSQCNRPCRPV
jgi:hypothetical protein